MKLKAVSYTHLDVYKRQAQKLSEDKFNYKELGLMMGLEIHQQIGRAHI